MKKIYIICLAALATPAIQASGVQPVTSKINNVGLQLIDDFKRGELSLDNVALLPPMSRGGAPMVKVVIESDAHVVDSLAAEGYELEYIADGFHIVTMPISEVEGLSLSDGIEGLSFGNVAEPQMNLARQACAVNTCHPSGLDFRLPHSFEGEGVIVGAYDTGFDPTHINFMTSDGSATRLIYYANYGQTTTPTILTGQETLRGVTDDPSESHATHVLGIAAGAYDGSGFTFSGNDKGYYSGQPLSQAGSNLGKIPYYGVAPKADLAVCAGALANTNILSGCRALVNYAKQLGRPIVINLSLGSNNGPHDGTETDVKALNALAAETVICISSGNEGDENIHADKTFTDEQGGSFSVMLKDKFNRYIDCWSSNSTTFDLAIQVVDKNNGNVIAQAECKDSQSLTVNNQTPGFEDLVTGSVAISPSLNSNNKRFNVYIYGNLSLKDATKYGFALKFTDNGASRIDVYGSSYCPFAGFPYDGYVSPNNDGSINGMACGLNTICVGSFNTRQWWFNTAGAPYAYNGSSSTDGTLSSFSSYGTLLDGRTLPDFCAPGSAIISSYSSPYLAQNPEDMQTAVAGYATKDNKTYYWGAMQGTSMACPYAVGVIALWLQSNPYLTSEQIKTIVESTCNKPSSGASIAWGVGKINANKGLREVINKYPTSGIEDVAVNGADITVLHEADGRLEVLAAGASTVAVQLYTVGGALAASVSSDGDTAQLSTDGLAKGVYVLRASADGSRTATRKIVL